MHVLILDEIDRLETKENEVLYQVSVALTRTKLVDWCERDHTVSRTGGLEYTSSCVSCCISSRAFLLVLFWLLDFPVGQAAKLHARSRWNRQRSRSYRCANRRLSF